MVTPFFTIKTNDKYQKEQAWIIDTILGDFLGLKYSIEFDQNISDAEIYYQDKVLHVKNILFLEEHDNWLTENSMPKQPLRKWRPNDFDLEPILTEPSVPILYGEGQIERVNLGKARLEIDIFGSCFFMLSRYEEVVYKERDKYGRFPARLSLAVKENFIQRPIVNEYLEILWSSMLSLWGDIERKERKFSKSITCDVDRPYQPGVNNFFAQSKAIAADLFKRKSLKRAVCSFFNYFLFNTGRYQFDPYYNRIKWIMDVNDRIGNKVIFYFIATNSSDPRDGAYKIDEPAIKSILSEISKRGHYISLHPSLSTFNNKKLLFEELELLKNTLRQQKIKIEQLGARQHYLVWDVNSTPQIYDSLGIHYDSSLAFAENVGFRAGTCYEYNFFDLSKGERLDLIISPLIVMETSIYSNEYMGLSEASDISKCIELMKHHCRLFNGGFVLLWHNDSFDDNNSQSIYTQACK